MRILLPIHIEYSLTASLFGQRLSIQAGFLWAQARDMVGREENDAVRGNVISHVTDCGVW